MQRGATAMAAGLGRALRWLFGPGPARGLTDGRPAPPQPWRRAAGVAAFLAVLAAIAVVDGCCYGHVRDNYLLIHTLAELFSILVGWGIFMLAWSARGRMQNAYLVLVGVAYLFVGLLDLLHTLSYRGMGIFESDRETNLATQLWMAARGMESIALLAGTLTFGRRARPRLWLGVFGVVTGVLVLSIFRWRVFPVCFVPGTGLTTFKIVGEYVICGILLAAAGMLVRHRRRFDPGVLRLIVWSVLITVAEEIAFTRYGADPYGVANLVGHYFKIVSFYLIYRAVIHTGLVSPQDLLFRDLKQSERALQEAREELERRVGERTSDLQRAVSDLESEVRNRVRAEGELADERRRLFSVLNMLPAYVALIARDRQVRFVNGRYLDFFGSPEGKPCHLLQRGRTSPCEECPVPRVLETGRPAQWEWTDEEGRSFQAWSYPFADVDGTAVALELGVEITERRMLEREVLNVSTLERQRIGQDLHDTVGQNLTGAAFMSRALWRKLQEGRGEPADAAAIEKLLNETIAQTRAIARGLCLVQTDEDGLLTAIRELAADTEEVYGVVCSVAGDGPVGVFEAPVATHLYRIAQEAVSNALKHGQASRIVIGLDADGEVLRLSVTDDGVGMPDDVDESEGLGLRIMQHRADSIGGALHVRANPDGGTVVECSVRRGRRVH